MKYIENFSHNTLNILIKDILKVDIIIPRLIFDYSINPNISNGYYMYQNIAGTVITLNMNSILELKYDNDIKTVIVYGFIHEIYHMFQPISSKYKTCTDFYTIIEDSADKYTIDFIRNNISIINSKLKFEFNEVFLKGIERQLKKYTNINIQSFLYNIKTIAGTLCKKLNINYDYLYNTLYDKNNLNIIFPDKSIIKINLLFCNIKDLESLIFLIDLYEFKFIKIIENSKNINYILYT